MSEIMIGDQGIVNESDLMHFGIKGMHWGIRRYQNEDGSLTEAGKRRYNKELAVGRERLKNRYKLTRAQTDTLQSSVKRKDQYSAANVDAVRSMIKKTLNDDVRTHAIGKKTIQLRNSAIAASSVGVGASIVGALALDSALPLVGVPATVALGASYIHKLKS